MIRKRHLRPIEAQPPRPKAREPRRKPPTPLVDLAVELDGYGELPGRRDGVSLGDYIQHHLLWAGEPQRVRLADLQRQGFNTTPPPQLYPPGSDPREEWMKLLRKLTDI